MNICAQVLVWLGVFISLGSPSRSGIAGFYGNSVFRFEELPNCFPVWLYYFTFLPATCGWGFQFHILANPADKPGESGEGAIKSERGGASEG